MYVILKYGGKQYKVSDNDVVVLEKVNAEAGDKVDLAQMGTVLFLSDDGKNNADRAELKQIKVNAKILEHFQDDKVLVFKYKAKKKYRRKRGHRQLQTRVLIESIGTGKVAKSEAKKSSKSAETEDKVLVAVGESAKTASASKKK